MTLIKIGLPNSLTLFRMGMIPVVIALFYWQNPWASWIAAFIFFMACVTDYLDGYVARTYDQASTLGKFLDPMADKLLVASTLLLLVGFHRIQGVSLIPTIIILCRELLVSGLREFLSDAEVSMPVTQLAKWKTALQMGSIGFLIAATPETPYAFLTIPGIVGLWFSAALTLITGYDYLRRGLIHIMESEK